MAELVSLAMEPAFAMKASTRKGHRSKKPQDSRGPALTEMFLGLENANECHGANVPVEPPSQRTERDDLSLQRHRSSTRGSKNNTSGDRAQLAPGEDLFLRENTSIARQHLTSSASQVRPAKQQARLTHGPGDTSRCPSNNNFEEDDEPILEEEGGRARGRLPMDWSYHNDYACTFTHYTEVSQAEDDIPLTHRPPSRQRHAFPTDLLVPREFFSPAKLGDASVSITPWHNDEDDDKNSSIGPEDDSGEVTESQIKASQHRTRPPSRYMTKPSRGSSSSSSSSASTGEEKRLTSRRGVAASFNQGIAQHHHDPKTDGFADVDESVPPPFRVEILTDSPQSQYIPSEHRRVDEDRRHSLKSRRSSSFGSRAQMKQQDGRALRQKLYAVVDEDDATRDASAARRPSKTRHSKKGNHAQWLAVEQEPYAATPTKRASRPSAPTRKAPEVDNSKVSTRATASLNAQQWFRATNNPFFESDITTPYEEMDPETAIANTPLFAGEDDLMAITQLSDLCLDDFMGDPYGSSVPASIAATSYPPNSHPGSSTSTQQPPASLNTSLGKDFLRLFAQH